MVAKNFLRLVLQIGTVARAARRQLAEQVAGSELSEQEFLVLWLCGDDAALTHRGQGELAEVVGVSPAQMSGLVDRLRRRNLLQFERLGRDRDLAVVFQVELRQSTKFMERFSSSYLREYLGLIREAVEAGQAEGLFRRDVSATAAAKILFGALDEMATNWMLSRRRYPLENDADTVIDLFLHGVGDRTRPVGGVA